MREAAWLLTQCSKRAAASLLRAARTVAVCIVALGRTLAGDRVQAARAQRAAAAAFGVAGAVRACLIGAGFALAAHHRIIPVLLWKLLCGIVDAALSDGAHSAALTARLAGA